jgi:glycosyltransferase involved in cell wall biosynthesis
MKNICFFNSTGFWGGGEKLHFEYALKFKSKGYGVFIFSANGSPLHKKSTGAKLIAHGFKIRNLSFLNPYTIYKLVQYFRKMKTDIVFFTTSQDVKAGGIAAKIAGVPKIVYMRGLAVPVKRSLINRIVLKSITTHIIASSEETARMILKNYSGVIPEQKVKVIYHGIDLKEFDNQKYTKIIDRTGNDIILGTVGRLTAIKGQTYLIEVAKKLKEDAVGFKLYIAGKGEMESELKEMAESYNLTGHVFFTGFLNDVKSFMTDLDIFVFPSLSEGFGFAIVEAMAAGKPVVAFNVSTNPELIADGQSGLLAEFPDTTKLTQKIKLLIDDKVLRIDMGKKGRLSVEKRFSVDQKINEIENSVIKTR